MLQHLLVAHIPPMDALLSRQPSAGSEAAGSKPTSKLHPLTLQFYDAALEREWVLEDFRATRDFVPLFSAVICTLSFVLINAWPQGQPGAPYIFPMFLTVGGVRLLVQRMADEEKAFQVFCWSWAFITLATFLGWLVAQRHFFKNVTEKRNNQYYSFYLWGGGGS